MLWTMTYPAARMFAVASDFGCAAKPVLELDFMIIGRTYQDKHAALVIFGVTFAELDMTRLKPDLGSKQGR